MKGQLRRLQRGTQQSQRVVLRMYIELKDSSIAEARSGKETLHWEKVLKRASIHATKSPTV